MVDLRLTQFRPLTWRADISVRGLLGEIVLALQGLTSTRGRDLSTRQCTDLCSYSHQQRLCLALGTFTTLGVRVIVS
jgi:hypothetical protein